MTFKMPAEAGAITRNVLVAIIVLAVTAALLALAGAELRVPPPWLLAWTEWVGDVVTIVVAGEVIWAGIVVTRAWAIRLQR